MEKQGIKQKVIKAGKIARNASLLLAVMVTPVLAQDRYADTEGSVTGARSPCHPRTATPGRQQVVPRCTAPARGTAGCNARRAHLLLATTFFRHLDA